jgi:hypothetical protein
VAYSHLTVAVCEAIAEGGCTEEVLRQRLMKSLGRDLRAVSGCSANTLKMLYKKGLATQDFHSGVWSLTQKALDEGL